MKSKNIALKSNNLVSADSLLQKRKLLDRDIALGWKLIRVENLVPKGVARTTDIKELYARLVNLSDDRLRTKLDIQCINIGLRARKELSDSAVYPLIYRLSELREREVAINKIDTLKKISTTTKSHTKYTNALSDTFLKGELKAIHIETTRILKTLASNNASTFFDTTEDYAYFAAA